MNIEDRIKKYTTIDDKFSYSYFATFVTKYKLFKMQRKADRGYVIKRLYNLRSGALANNSEKRMVLHHLLRKSSQPSSDNILDIWHFYRMEKQRCYEFASKINDGTIKSSAGKVYKNFIQVGVGGSILGAQFLCKAFSGHIKRVHPDYRAIFISNIDEKRIEFQLENIDLTETLFFFATKSGVTKEIEIDRKIIADYIKKAIEKNPEGMKNFDLASQSVLLTSISSPAAESTEYFEKFYIDNNIGGRFSISSVMGLAINAIVYGKDVCEEFLSGMEYMDDNSSKKNIKDNISLLSALMNYYEQKRYFIDQNIISPYSDTLRDLPQYLSQLFMESLGKDHNTRNKRIYYRTGQFFFGDRGIACQHSFYQMLHNGTASANIEFIAFGDQKALLGNCLAQSISLYSRNNENLHRKVINKILYFDKYTPFNLGQIVSFYENKVTFLGFLYDINSYDQPGVEFGKRLYRELENNENKELIFLSKYLKGGRNE